MSNLLMELSTKSQLCPNCATTLESGQTYPKCLQCQLSFCSKQCRLDWHLLDKIEYHNYYSLSLPE